LRIQLAIDLRTRWDGLPEPLDNRQPIRPSRLSLKGSIGCRGQVRRRGCEFPPITPPTLQCSHNYSMTCIAAVGNRA
jgi:hypothetical protein